MELEKQHLHFAAIEIIIISFCLLHQMHPHTHIYIRMISLLKSLHEIHLHLSYILIDFYKTLCRLSII
jgi:hypothetical protein